MRTGEQDAKFKDSQMRKQKLNHITILIYDATLLKYDNYNESIWCHECPLNATKNISKIISNF